MLAANERPNWLSSSGLSKDGCLARSRSKKSDARLRHRAENCRAEPRIGSALQRQVDQCGECPPVFAVAQRQRQLKLNMGSLRHEIIAKTAFLRASDVSQERLRQSQRMLTHMEVGVLKSFDHLGRIQCRQAFESPQRMKRAWGKCSLARAL